MVDFALTIWAYSYLLPIAFAVAMFAIAGVLFGVAKILDLFGK